MKLEDEAPRKSDVALESSDVAAEMEVDVPKEIAEEAACCVTLNLNNKDGEG
jgi:hypothetical protein